MREVAVEITKLLIEFSSNQVVTKTKGSRNASRVRGSDSVVFH